MKGAMLKFVSTKPPRGRTNSGSQTPERDMFQRQQNDSLPRAHTSPRVSKKNYQASQTHTYPASRSGHSSSTSPFPPSYRQYRSSPRSCSPTSASNVPYQAESPTQYTPFMYPNKPPQRCAGDATQHRQASTPQPNVHRQQYQQHQQLSWPPLNLQNPNNQPTIEETSSIFSELPRTQSKDNQPFGSYSFQSNIHSNSIKHSQSASTTSSNSFRPRNIPISKDFKTIEQLNYGSSNITSPPAGNSFIKSSSYTRSSSDYDLAKPILDYEDSNSRTQHTLPRTTQYIINESMTKKKTSTTYIPPTGSGIELKTFREAAIENTPQNSSIGRKRQDYTAGVAQDVPPGIREYHFSPAKTSQVMTTCVPQIYNSSSNDAMNKIQSSNRSIGLSSQMNSSASTMRDMFNKSQGQAMTEGVFTLDLIPITDRITALTFPSEGHDQSYVLSLKEVIRMLKTKYGEHFLILNLSEKNEDLSQASSQVKEFGWPDHLAPPLERLCTLCKALDSWLSANVKNVVFLHCRGGSRRVASVIAAYVQYNNICASADPTGNNVVAMKRFYDEKLADLPLPSQRRYVSYFSGLLSGNIRINSNPIFLHHILIHGAPNFDAKGGCQPFLKIYQSMQPVFTSGVYNVTENMQKVCISITPGIPLRGDILIKCYHKRSKTGQREVMWQCQFHTCAVADNKLVFTKQELDDALLDPRFPDTGKVEFVFGPSSDVLVSVSGFKSDVTVPVVENDESLVRTDSYENFHKVLETVDAVDINKNGITSSQVTADRNVISQHTLDINHRQAPDGSLYATVTKRDPVTPSAPSAKAPSLTLSTSSANGSVHIKTASSLNSGYLGQNGDSKPHHALSAGKNINSDPIGAPYSSQVHQTNQNISTLNKKASQTVDERTQLDELLSNLLGDQAYVPPSQQSTTPAPTPAQLQSSSGATLTVSPTMNSAKTVTTTTRTFTSYSTTDAHRNPDQVLIQRSEVSYKVPEHDHQVKSASSNQSQAYNPRGMPSNAFSYTSGQYNTQRAQASEREGFKGQPESSIHPTSSNQHGYPSEPPPPSSSSSYPYSSLDGETNSWLAQQQQKLKNFREGRDSSGRSDQEKRLVNQLQFAQNKYYTHSSQTEVEDRDIQNSLFSRQQHYNGPISPQQVPISNGAPQSSLSSESPWSQDQFYNTSYSSSSYTESHSYGDKQSHKPPPSPAAQRPPAQSPGPLPVPARSSSREYMRSRSNSGGSGWTQQQEQLQPPRPLQRQHSETLYDKNRDAEHIPPRNYGSAHNTPPQSPPRAASPLGPRSTTTYTTYRTIHKQKEAYEDQQRANKVLQQQQQPQQPVQPTPPPQQVSHHYVTEVFVHRNDQNKDTSNSLNELEKNLEAASQSIMSSQQHTLRHLPSQQQQQVVQESVVSHSSQQFRTYQESVSSTEFVSSQHGADHSMTRARSPSPELWDNVSKPEPPRVKEIEEDRIILRPIGPGMQTLEPESVHTGTLGRPTTPGFPTGPGGGAQFINPTGTLQHQQQQQQQQVHYQQYQSQQYQSQTSHHDGTLHIDTSNRMVGPQHSPAAGSPQSPGSSFNTLRQQLTAGSVGSLGPHSVTGQSSPTVYFGLSRRGSVSSLTDADTVHATPKFVKDTSKYWYKPNISRDEAIQLLKDKPPGTFVIRDSNSFPGAFGLALKVATIPPNVQAKPSGDPQADLVRHFLIEPTPKGVRLRGCSNEPVFGSLAALVYQHSITALALPTKLSLQQPDTIDGVLVSESSSVSATEHGPASTLLAQGAACNVIYINSLDLESLTGPQAIAKAVKMSFEGLTPGQTTVVHFKVFDQGITLTDNNRKLFFRRHYPVSAVTYCGMDPQDRRWKREIDAPGGHGDARIFGFVARKHGTATENTCHIFAELDPEQPASAIVNFVTKVMIGQSKVKT